MTGSRRRRCGLLGLLALICCSTGRAGDAAQVTELAPMLIVGTTLLPGSGVALQKLPANVQVYGGHDLLAQRALDLTQFLEQNATGLSVNAAQGNAYQPDVNFRGFAASPVLGTPQGVSVFLDGVRINEPFADAVNWDLIPQSAIASVQLIPGSSPAFGLNTLGGAIALYSKRGAIEYPDRPGGSISVSGGSFGRRTVGAEGGGRSGPWDWFAAANHADDRGWAEHNASRVRQAFARLGWQDGPTDIDLTLGAADNRLEGTQTLPLSFTDIRQAYTWPDLNTNRAAFAALKAGTALTPTLQLSANLYFRRLRNGNLSSNVVDDGAAADPVQATNDASRIAQNSHGAAVQLVHSAVLAGRASQLSLGIGIDQGRARYTRSTQDAAITADRGTQALSGFAATTDADATTRNLGVYVSDSLDFAPRWTLTAAGRYNRADLGVADRSGSAPALDGAHRYARFNPALGLNYSAAPGWTVYGNANQGMRAPTAIELTCADPAAPCKLPNDFIADPALKPVVATTVEVGARGRAGTQTKWSAAVFRSDLRDDLQFVSSNGLALNAGYFQNVGTTRRQGLELAGSTRLGALALSANCSFVDATFRSDFVANSPNNSSADINGAIAVRRGDRMPSIPRQALKARLEWQAAERWTVAAMLQADGAVYARGDENNRDASGRVPGYALMGLDARWQLDRGLELYLRIDNLFDRRYANFGILGRNAFTGPAQSLDVSHARAEQFRGWGTPRGAWGGVEFRFE